MKFIYYILFFDIIEEMKSIYINKDIYISKIKILNVKYILDENYDTIIITLRNGTFSELAFIYNDINNSVEMDLSALNLKFDEIQNIQFN